MKSIVIRIISLVLVLVSLFGCTVVANADTAETPEGHIHFYWQEAEEVDNTTVPYGIYPDMAIADFWKYGEPDIYEILMTKEEVALYNADLIGKFEYTDCVQIELVTSIPQFVFQPIDSKADMSGIDQQAMIATYEAGRTVLGELKYAVATTRCNITTWPTTDFFGFNPDMYPDVFNPLAALNINDPFVVSESCNVNGHIYYYGRSKNCSGWVDGDYIAICSSKDEWLDSWQVDITARDFIVVTRDRFNTEVMISQEETDEVELFMGTVLKEVPRDELVRWYGERNGSWYNHVVWLPCRNTDGSYYKVMALIPWNRDVSLGYMDLTKANILDIAFNQLGNRFGWGCSLKAYDAAGYVNIVYRCFGFDFPRYAVQQRFQMQKYYDLTGMSASEKHNFLMKCPIGTIFYLKGRYEGLIIGREKKIVYIIHDVDLLSCDDGPLDVRKMRDVIVSTFEVRRSNGNTFEEECIGVCIPWEFQPTDAGLADLPF